MKTFPGVDFFKGAFGLQGFGQHILSHHPRFRIGGRGCSAVFAHQFQHFVIHHIQVGQRIGRFFPGDLRLPEFIAGANQIGNIEMTPDLLLQIAGFKRLSHHAGDLHFFHVLGGHGIHRPRHQHQRNLFQGFFQLAANGQFRVLFGFAHQYQIRHNRTGALDKFFRIEFVMQFETLHVQCGRNQSMDDRIFIQNEDGFVHDRCLC